MIDRANGKIYVFARPIDGEFRAGEQFLRMMQRDTLAEWKDAMRMRARLNSSFTYADRAGNIFYLWNAAIPDSAASERRRHRRDSGAPHVGRVDALRVVRLTAAGAQSQGRLRPQRERPPYYTNMREPLDPAQYPSYFPAPRLGLRSQLAIDLIDNDRKMSLEDVVALKHSYRMLLADRVRDDLVAAVRATNPTGDVAKAIDMIAAWDKTVAPESRGGTLFEAWWRRYIARRARRHDVRRPWSAAHPTTTPRGIRDPSARSRRSRGRWTTPSVGYGAFDVEWGDVHRVRRGNVDVPVGGCGSDLGCFRVLTYRDGADGKREAMGSDGWILAVEFGDEPRAYSVLAYGESPKPDSPYFSDQAEMFARGELKPVAWNEKDIEAQTVKRYRPGEAP